MDYKKEIQKLLDSLKSKGFGRRAIEKQLNYSEKYIDQALAKGGNDKLYNSLELLLKAIPYEVGGDEARMLHETGDVYVNKGKREFIELSDGKYIMNTPLITQKAYAGYLTGWGDPEYIEELPTHPVIVDKPHMGTYRSFEAKGDSMNDGTSRSIDDKDILIGRRIERSYWRTKLHLVKYKEFVIVTFKKGIVTKNIIEHDTDNHTITCHSYNPDKDRYPDFILNLDDVMEIYNIVQITKKR